jgi:glucose-1-phosphate cytidylyltransferase
LYALGTKVMPSKSFSRPIPYKWQTSHMIFGRIGPSSTKTTRSLGVTLVETGLDTMTGGRIKRVKPYIGNETFCLTYGDGLSDVNIQGLIEFHRTQGGLATLTAVQPPGRFGAFSLEREEQRIKSFKEKPRGDGAWINGGFFVLEPGVIDFIESDASVWEQEPMEKLAQQGKLSAFRHHGFWQPMDTLRDKNLLEKLWQSGTAPWKTW